MEYRKLGRSGLSVPVLSFGTATFGGGNDFFKAWGSTGVAQAKRKDSRVGTIDFVPFEKREGL